MWKISKTNTWASCVTCLAIALAAGSAFAENEEIQKDASDDSQQQSSEQQDRGKASQSDQKAGQSEDQSKKGQQDRERDQQAQQRNQKDGQWNEQDKQRDQQTRQRDQKDQSRSGDERSRDRDSDQWSEWPQPTRGQIGRGSQQNRNESRWSDDSDRQWQYGSSQQRNMGRGGKQAELGVSIESDGREGITVIRVHQGSPAEEMGIEEGDRITSVNGRQVRSTDQFISQIRNMSPGEEVEIDIRRDREEQTFRGELDARSDSIAYRGQQRDRYGDDRDNWQTSYEEERSGSQPQRRIARGGDVSGQLERIERQVNQLSREIDQLRYALQDIRRESGERTAGYDEYQSRTMNGQRRSTNRDGESNRDRPYDGGREIQRSNQDESGERSERSSQSGTYQQGSRTSGSGQRDGQSSSFDDNDQFGSAIESPGGEIGEDRLRPGTAQQNRN